MTPEFYDFLIVMSAFCTAALVLLGVVYGGLWIGVRFFGLNREWME